MKAKEVARNLKNKSFREQYHELGEKYIEQAEEQIESRTHGTVTKNTVKGVVKNLKDWIKAAARELDWPHKLAEIFWQHYSAKLLEEYGFRNSQMKKAERAAEKAFEKMSKKEGREAKR